jgi:hypothetical protein
MSFDLYQFLYRFSHYGNRPISVNYTCIRQDRANIIEAFLTEGCSKKSSIHPGGAREIHVDVTGQPAKTSL